jgi:hypothetical protein
MSSTPARPIREISGERVLFAMLAASLALVGTIAGAALLPEALGVAVALAALLVALATVGAFVRTLLRDDPAEAEVATA